MSAISPASVQSYVDVLSSVARAINAGQLGEARELLAPIAWQRWDEPFKLAAKSSSRDRPTSATKRTVTDRARAATYIRDSFICQYCGQPVIPLAVLVGISDVLPTEFAYHTNYKRGEIHPAFWIASEADHLVAHAHGGSSGIENLITLHAMCNLIKSDSDFDDLPQLEHPAKVAGWDGLVPLLPSIAAAGNGMHARMIRHWIRLFETSQEQIAS